MDQRIIDPATIEAEVDQRPRPSPKSLVLAFGQVVGEDSFSIELDAACTVSTSSPNRR